MVYLGFRTSENVFPPAPYHKRENHLTRSFLRRTRWTCFIRVTKGINFTSYDYNQYCRSFAQLEKIILSIRLLLSPSAFRYGQSRAVYSKCSCPQPERCGGVPNTDSSPSPRVCPRVPVGQCIHLQVSNCPTITETRYRGFSS
jgi:hypothetical protein